MIDRFLLSAAIVVGAFLPLPASAQSALISGHYASGGYDLVISGGNNNTTNAGLNFAAHVGSCTGEFDYKLIYALPPNYDGAAIDITSSSCTGIVQCPGYTATCAGIAPSALRAGFRQDTTKQITGTLNGTAHKFTKVESMAERKPISLIARYQLRKQSAGTDRDAVVTGFNRTIR